MFMDEDHDVYNLLLKGSTTLIIGVIVRYRYYICIYSILINR